MKKCYEVDRCSNCDGIKLLLAARLYKNAKVGQAIEYRYGYHFVEGKGKLTITQVDSIPHGFVCFRVKGSNMCGVLPPCEVELVKED